MLCEKPLALTLGTRTIFGGGLQGGVRMQVGFRRRYDSCYAAAMSASRPAELAFPVIFKSIGARPRRTSALSYQSNVKRNVVLHEHDS